MDLLDDIKEKLRYLTNDVSAPGMDAVFRHIDRAEHHLWRGREFGEDDAFNDAIYRANQAFEGSLKEAFLVLNGRAATDLSAQQIEQELLQKKALVPRAADLLTNYRKSWRNPSTHDHRLVFGGQEAFLAIVSVSAFVSVLLDQMVEAIGFRREREEAERREQQLKETLGRYDELPFEQQVVRLLTAFSEMGMSHGDGVRNEFGWLGHLTGFIAVADDKINIQRQPQLEHAGRELRPDLVLTKGVDTVVVEIRRVLAHRRDLTSARHQVASYLLAGGWTTGVVFVPGSQSRPELRVDAVDWQIGGNKRVKIYAIYALDGTPAPLEEVLSASSA